MDNNFFISDLSETELEKIQKAGVDFCSMEIDEVEGIVIGQESIYSALETIGAGIDSKNETSVEGILKISLKDAPTPSEELKPKEEKYKVQVSSWEGHQRDKFCEVAREKLLPYLNKNIILSVPHQHTIKPKGSDDEFYIFIWSSPSGNAEKKVPEKLWGIEVDCRDIGFYPSGKGIPIIDEESGWVAAELVGENLYIHYDLCHKGTSREIKIFQKICEKTIEVSNIPPEEIEKRRRKAMRKIYTDECIRQIKKSVQEKEEEAHDLKRRVRETQKELTHYIRKAKKAESMAQHLRETEDEEIERCGEEFDSLNKIEGVEKIQVSKGVIKVFTEHIYITPEESEDTFDIGKFRMEIYTRKGRIKFFNTTRKGKGGDYNTNHPHVNESGNPCLGNISESVPELIAGYQYSAVAQLGLQFLKSVNTSDSAGKGIFEYWPKVGESKE